MMKEHIYTNIYTMLLKKLVSRSIVPKIFQFINKFTLANILKIDLSIGTGSAMEYT